MWLGRGLGFTGSVLGKQDGHHEAQRWEKAPNSLEPSGQATCRQPSGVCSWVPGLTVLVLKLFSQLYWSFLLWHRCEAFLPALGLGLRAMEAAGVSPLCVAGSSSHGRLHPSALLRALPQRLLRQLIYSVQTPVALFRFLAIIAQKLGLAVPRYGILGREGNPPQLAASLNRSGEANGNCAKWSQLFFFLILKLGLKGRVGLSMVARSLCLKAPVRAEGSGEGCCGAPGASSGCGPIAEHLSLTGRPAAKKFPNLGLHLPYVVGLLVGSMRVVRVWADVILHWHAGMEARKEWTSSAVSIWDPSEKGNYCGMSRCPQLLQGGNASVPTCILGCFSSGSVNPAWKVRYAGALHLKLCSWMQMAVLQVNLT